MHLFIATLSTETNSFAPMPTALSGFEEYFLRYGTATAEPANLMTEALHVWRNRAERLGWQVSESIAAIAEPAGPTTRATYDQLRGRLLGDLSRAAPDIILLQLHGAMIAEGEDDCEGDIIAAARALCPDAVIGVSLDLHCHLTDRMVAGADIVLTFKEYPHDDASLRAEELFDLAKATHAGQIQPVMAVFDCRLIGLYLTKTEPMAGFVRDMCKAEARRGVLSLSLAHGFPWADVADVGTRMLVVTDNDRDLAQRMARDFGRRFFALRHDVTPKTLDLATALDQAESAPSPVVIADMGDNSGAGAAGDATFTLKAILDSGIHDVALGLIWDPQAVHIAVDVGIGATRAFRIGGKTGPLSGDPVDVTARVADIAHGIGQHLGPGLEPMGTVVRLTLAGGVDVLINDLRVQVYHPEAFEQLGLDLAEKRLIAVKSTFHFYGPFAAIAPTVLQVATPGGSSPDMMAITYSRRDQTYWPRVEDPFA